MPSFRARLTVRGMLPGHRPPEILEAARDAVPDGAHCDDVRLDVPHGVPVLTVRFSLGATSRADEDARAWTCAEEMGEALVQPPRLLRRRGGDWLALPR